MPRGVYERRGRAEKLIPYQGDNELRWELRQLRPTTVPRYKIDPRTGWPQHNFPPDDDPNDRGAVRLDAKESLTPRLSTS